MPLKQIIVAVLLGVVLYPFSIPITGQAEQLLVIPQGKSVAEIGQDLKRAGIINSELAFRVVIKLERVGSSLKAGRYLFGEPMPIWDVAKKIANGDYGTKIIKFTIPEGSSNKQISTILGLDIGEVSQGYLFPDTYYFDQFATADEMRNKMLEHFNSKVGTTTKEEQIVVASILEREVRSKEDMELVAGIMYKRLKLDMPLQIDAVPSTYDIRGLPDDPVCNPGLQAIQASRNPRSSQYLYYLSDKNGVTHYATNFDEHKMNRTLYLR